MGRLQGQGQDGRDTRNQSDKNRENGKGQERIGAILLSDEKAGKGEEKGDGSDAKWNHKARMESILNGRIGKAQGKRSPASVRPERKEEGSENQYR